MAEKRRICRTPDESFQAGWDDGEHDAPLTREEITRLVARLRPYLRDLLPDQAA